MTDQPTGRALAEAAARAMGWRSWHDGPVAMAMGPGWVEPDGTIHGVEAHGGPDIPERECLAWLHERGIVRSASSKKVCEVWHMSLPAMEVTPSVDQDNDHDWVRGATMLEALQRLVVAVAEREASHG